MFDETRIVLVASINDTKNTLAGLRTKLTENEEEAEALRGKIKKSESKLKELEEAMKKLME